MKRLAGYFVRGLIVLLPTCLTIYLIWKSISWLDRLFEFNIPGVGLLIVLIGITLTGILFSGLIGRTLFHLVDVLMSHTPLVKIIYSSLKDLIDAFVGEKKKFNEPVLVTISVTGAQAMGFITNHDLQHFGITDKVAVYFPYSYAITGHVLIIPKAHITPIHANSTDVMRFIVSGGITGS
jgi:uncharacterized membrane protein